MSGGRFTKQLPEHIYFVGKGEWISGPYVRPQRGRANSKFLITEVPMDEPKKKKKK